MVLTGWMARPLGLVLTSWLARTSSMVLSCYLARPRGMVLSLVLTHRVCWYSRAYWISYATLVLTGVMAHLRWMVLTV